MAPLALVLMILFGMLFTAVKPEPLDVPLSFGTTTGRDWLVPLTNAPVWVLFAAAGPALLASILIYLDQNITARLINSPDHKLKKGEAYHLIRRVPNWTIHKFTLLQVICLVILWVVKVSMYAILFLIFIALLVPVRAIAGRFFAPEHLEALDAQQLPAEEKSEWA